MALYCGIDLHSTSSHLCVIDETDREHLSKKVENRLDAILRGLAPYREELVGVVVESTFNWYWLEHVRLSAACRRFVLQPPEPVLSDIDARWHQSIEGQGGDLVAGHRDDQNPTL